MIPSFWTAIEHRWDTFRWDSILIVILGLLFALGTSGVPLSIFYTDLMNTVSSNVGVWYLSSYFVEGMALGTVGAFVLMVAILLHRNGAGVVSPSTTGLTRNYLSALFR